MAHLIDKDALVAEIKKVIDEPAPSHDQQCNWEDGYYYYGLYKAESIIDSFEVKEVDLDFAKEADVWIRNNEDTNGFFNVQELAKYFFELGMSVSNKAQKEE